VSTSHVRLTIDRICWVGISLGKRATSDMQPDQSKMKRHKPLHEVQSISVGQDTCLHADRHKGMGYVVGLHRLNAWTSDDSSDWVVYRRRQDEGHTLASP
jgi:hypothetical protein